MKKVLVLLLACMASLAMFAQEHYWSVVTVDLSQNLTLKIRSVLAIDGEQPYNGEGMEGQGGENFEIGAFSEDGVCRCSCFPTWDSKYYRYVYDLQIYGESGFHYTFRVYDHNEGVNHELTNLVEDFENNYVHNGASQSFGTRKNPIVLNFHDTGGATPMTLTKDIVGYGTSEGGYYLIATPLGAVTPAADNGFLTDAYDLYWFNQSADKEWINYENVAFDLATGKGYLYASQEDTQLTFTGTPVEGDTYEVTLAKVEGKRMEGWNLVGNPFAVEAFCGKPYYTLNEERSEVMTETVNDPVPAMEGVFVKADTDGESLVFSKEASGKTYNLSLNLVQNSSVIDRAIVNFGAGQQLPKFQLRSSSTKLYIPMDGEDYAVVSSAEMGEMPVNFKAEKSGSYTLAVSSELSFNYLHLIDNKTGVDVDLLANPSYSFDAETTDYASRFRLVFATGNSDDTFAFYSNGSFVISNEGEAVVQVMDVTGRMLSSEAISGSASINVEGAAGVYMIRLVNGENVKVQKVVVK